MSETTPSTSTSTTQAVKPILNLKFISHGTLESADFDRTRRFYSDFMGFDVVRSSNQSMMIRLGGQHVYVVVPKEEGRKPMSVRNHNGVDVATDAEVDTAYQAVLANAAEWSITKVSKPMLQHGTYSFYFWDLDENSWEIQSNPKGGYSWMYERGDQTGKGSQERGYTRPELVAY